MPLTLLQKFNTFLTNHEISTTSRLLFSSLSGVNVPVSQHSTYFACQVRGYEHMRCTQLEINKMICVDSIDLKNYNVDLFG